MLQQLFSFKGGVKPQTRKAPSVQSPIGQAPMPVRLYVPLHQSSAVRRILWCRPVNRCSKGR
jgi:Na+-translocating ferredoxin:NAD+ oxidoreductase RnfC subunit